MSVLEDLYSGKIYPLENIVSHNPAYRPTNEKIGDMRSYFSEKLLPEDREKFKEWNQLLHESNCMDAYANFAYGFRLAFIEEQAGSHTGVCPASVRALPAGVPGSAP